MLSLQPYGNSSRWFDLSSSNIGHDLVHWNDYRKSCIGKLQYTFIDLLSNTQKPLGIHHIRTILFSLPVTYLKDLMNFGLDKGSTFHRQTSVMTWFIEMIIENPVLGIICIISMLVHSTSQCLTSFTNIQKSTECTFDAVNDIFSRTLLDLLKHLWITKLRTTYRLGRHPGYQGPHLLQHGTG
jgi:hypothetical protein